MKIITLEGCNGCNGDYPFRNGTVQVGHRPKPPILKASCRNTAKRLNSKNQLANGFATMRKTDSLLTK